MSTSKRERDADDNLGGPIKSVRFSNTSSVHEIPRDENKDEKESDVAADERSAQLRYLAKREKILPFLGSKYEGDENGEFNIEDFKGFAKSRLTRVSGEVDSDPENEETNNENGEIPIIPFNLNEERKIGYFTKDGNYVYKKDEREKDSWMDQIYDQSFASDAKKRKDLDQAWKEKQEKETKEESEEIEIDIVSLLTELQSLLQTRENTYSAMKRFKKANDMQSFNRVTELADELLLSGENDIYEETKEKLTLTIERRKNQKPSQPKELHKQQTWFYRIGLKTFGPFSTQSMKEWNDQGYFIDAEVFVQRGETFDEQDESLWENIKDVSFD